MKGDMASHIMATVAVPCGAAKKNATGIMAEAKSVIHMQKDVKCKEIKI